MQHAALPSLGWGLTPLSWRGLSVDSHASVAALPNDGHAARRGFKHALVQEVTHGWVIRVRSRGWGLAPLRPADVRLTPRTGFLDQGSMGHQLAIVEGVVPEDGSHGLLGVGRPRLLCIRRCPLSVRLPRSSTARRGLKTRYRPSGGVMVVCLVRRHPVR